ncbi:MAG TPA: winged helix-turn-helix domain-containing protein [Steroidobacteraceae bacterium]|nr:winged helix-turn-helix domain-containing protein [Steroidobacteraceae bacterium]
MPSGDKEGALQIGEWIVNPSLDSISKGTETQKLEPRTMRLLLCLANSAGEVVSVDRLLNEVWTGVVVGSASVYQSVSQLRKLLGDVDPEPTYIATVPRKGYRLVAPVTQIDAPSETSAAAAVPSAEPTPLPPRTRTKVPLLLGAALLIALIAVGAVIWKKTSTDRLLSTVNSIVVLPFIDMTAEKSDQSFCDGLTEELSSWLAQIPTLRVVARTSAFAFRGQGQDVRKIGKALDTNHILEGSLRRAGDRMRISVQLIDARTGYHLWSEDFDRPFDDAIKIQEDISRSVAGTLQVRLTTDSERQLAARRTDDPQAYQMFLLGRHYAQLLPEATDRAIELYRQVLVADAKFTPAYTELAYALLNEGQFRGTPIVDVAAQVEPLIATALRLDNRMSAAYAVRGALRASQSRTGEALDDLQHAISLNPSDMGALAEIGRIHLFDGEPREALKGYDRAAALDPLNSTLQGARCTVLQDMAQYEAASNACERARTLRPGTAWAADALTWLAESQGHIEEALRWNSAAILAEPHQQFNFYLTRATLLLAVGLADSARKAVETGRSATRDEDGANIELLRVSYREGGAGALRKYLDSTQLDRSPHAGALFEAAYSRLLLNDATAAKNLIARALVAPDRPPGYAETPWYARGAGPEGNSYRLDLAVAETMLGEHAAANRDLDAVLSMLNNMIASGVERYGTYELRAKVYALQGRGDDALRDLGKAVNLGWRRSWWAANEPYFASLQSRSDFQALLAQVSRSNDRLTENIHTDF